MEKILDHIKEKFIMSLEGESEEDSEKKDHIESMSNFYKKTF